jgi:aarF domain-containing kinase
MVESYGPHWKDSITLHEIIGSGCIGQVYRGTVKIASPATENMSDHSSITSTTATTPTTKNEAALPHYQEVAIKVIHPNVRKDIDTDMDIIRHIIRWIQYVNPGIQKQCRYLNIDGVLDEFQKLLKLQMDLRYEARNLQRFQENFAHDPVIQFPQLLYHNHPSSSSSLLSSSTKKNTASTTNTPASSNQKSSTSSTLLYPPNENVLIETYCDGIPILKYCRENHISNAQQLTKLCYHGIRAVCQMIFLDNFVHGK